MNPRELDRKAAARHAAEQKALRDAQLAALPADFMPTFESNGETRTVIARFEDYHVKRVAVERWPDDALKEELTLALWGVVSRHRKHSEHRSDDDE